VALPAAGPPGVLLDKRKERNYAPGVDFITPTSDDDPRFLVLARRVIASSLRRARLASVFIVRIDHWFDHKWFAFAGKLYGALAFHKPQRLTIPPFIPDRVVSEDVFTLDVAGGAYRKSRAPSLHRYQHSGENLSRFIGHVSESGLFVWFSGGTSQSEHGSLMVYSTYGETRHGWYASFRLGEDWRLYKVEGLSRAELMSMIGSGSQKDHWTRESREAGRKFHKTLKRH